MARSIPNRPFSQAAQAHAKVIEARRQLEQEQEAPPLEPQEEPMHRYIHSIPRPVFGGIASSNSSHTPGPELTQILEHLQEQNQLLVDLLGAVNSLTAALLCRRG